MGFYFVDPETYNKYKDEILELSHAVQVNFQEHLPTDKRQPGLSDQQIAEKLSLRSRTRQVSARRIRRGDPLQGKSLPRIFGQGHFGRDGKARYKIERKR
jgi:hypothetical protein